MFGDVWLGFRRVGRCYEGNLKVWRKVWKGIVARNLQASQGTGKACRIKGESKTASAGERFDR
jgi:hypothetical protein